MQKALTTISIICLLLTSPIQGRTCTKAEKAAGDLQLTNIQNDDTLKQAIHAKHLPYGAPISQHPKEGGPENEDILYQKGYVMSHDKDLRTALWVSYKLTKTDTTNAEGKERVDCFRKDPRFDRADTATKSDYNEPFFDQGHMANDADLKDNLTEQINSYVMSNMSPQHCRFNRGIWLTLEYLGRELATEYEKIYVTSGAVFDYQNKNVRVKDKTVARMGSRNQKARVAVPSDYYKIFMRKVGNKWHSLAFLLENNNEAHGSSWAQNKDYALASIKTIEEIEDAADTKFFPSIQRADIIQNDHDNWVMNITRSNLEGGCK